MANEFIARNGIIALNSTQVTGSLSVTGGIVGSLTGNVTGTASTASYVAGSNVSGNITGNAANVTGTVAVANGGTGATTTTTINSTSITYGTTNTITAANPNALTISTGLSGTSYNGSSAVTIANTGVLSFNTRTGAVTLAASDISGLAAGIVSGSSQINGASITNNTVTVNGTAIGLGSSGTITAANPNALTIGTGLSGTSYTGGAAVTIANTGVLSITTNTGLSTNASATGNVTITNTGVTSNVAGTGISVSGATGAVTITNSGVTSAVAGTGVSVSSGTGAVTISIGQSVATSATPTFSQVFASLNGTGENFKVGDDCWIGDINAANTLKIKGVQDATAGYITFGNQTTALGLTNSTTLTWGASFTATGDVTAYSDARVKENVNTIVGALGKVLALRGVTYTRTDIEDKSEKVGFIAQEVQEVLPQVVIEEQDRLSVAYGNISALHNEAIKELNTKVEAQQVEINELKALVNQLLNK